MNITKLLATEIENIVGEPVTVTYCKNPLFGDYQCTDLINIAKKKGLNPIEFANYVKIQLINNKKII